MRSSFTGLFAAATLFTGSLAFGDNAGGQSFTRRAESTAVTGIRGSVKPRLEIRQLQQSQPDQWTLFVLAMDRFHQTQMDDATGTGYYGIAGIHGVPPVSWGGVEQCANCTNGPPGYCTHVSVHFPAWHRVYMALFEQTLVGHARDIAKLYSGAKQAAMQQAAEDLRCPYWDWAAVPPTGQPAIPLSMTDQSITVDGPQGNQTIANPLFQHNFKNPSNLVYDPYVEWQETIRHPTSNAADASSNEQDLINLMQSRQPELQSEVYSMYQQCHDYLAFSNTGSATQQCSTSIEAIHNDVHSFLGGLPDPSGKGPQQGHMTYLPLAAFDPAFWVHHANVDRLFAMWQAVNPSSYGASDTAKLGTWTIQAGSVQDSNSPLTPFKKTSGDFWTTNDVRDWAGTFGYSYPEFLSSDGSSNAIQNYINALYGPVPVLTAGSVPASVIPSKPSPGTPTPSSGASLPFKNLTGPAQNVTGKPSNDNNPLGSLFPHLPDLSHLPKLPNALSGLPNLLNGALAGLGDLLKPGVENEQYLANIQTPRAFFNGTYSIYLFDGAAGEASSAWATASNLVGMMNVLTGGMAMPKDLISYGSISMTKYIQKLVSQGTIPSMSSKDVLPYLNKHLEWRIVSAQGVTSPEKVKGFALSVVTTTATNPGQGLLPVWQPVMPQLQVTKGKKGGASELPKIVDGFIQGLMGNKASSKDDSPVEHSSTPSDNNTKTNTPSPQGEVVTMTTTMTTTYCPCKTATA